MRLSEKLKNISLLITKSEELIDNQQPVFFRIAMDVQMRNVVSDVKLQLNDSYHNLLEIHRQIVLWGIERSGFFNGREKWAKGFENQMV